MRVVTKGNVGTGIGQNTVNTGPGVFSDWSGEKVREPADLRKHDFSLAQRQPRRKGKSALLSGAFSLMSVSPDARLSVPTTASTATNFSPTGHRISLRFT